jgi:tetratricopeptide (TPR) repeat protein
LSPDVSNPPLNLAPALDRYRRGDLAGAGRAIEAALASEPDSVELLGFAGLVAAQTGDFPAAARHWRAALAATPDDLATRVNLARALVAAGEHDEACAVCAAGGDDPKLLRLAAYAHQQEGRLEQAARAYRSVVAAFPADFESWNNLGNVLAARHELDAAIDALRRAITLRPDFLPMVMNLSEVLAKAERHDERRAMLREAALVSPEDAALQTELGLAESSVRDFEAAERAYREALRLDPRNLSALLELGLLLENLNRVDDLAALVEQAEAEGVSGAEMGFIKAWALRRQGRLEEALPLAEATPASINPVRRAQLLAELYDRLGRPDAAFEAFVDMNREAVAAKPAPPGPTYRDEIAANAALITPDRIGSWTDVEVPPEPPAPVFIVGFPRSGTTLLDTLLMNIPHFHVLEELPVLPLVETALGDTARLARLSSDEATALRRRYFDVLETLSPVGPGRTIVDKHPLHMARMPVIHRIFPDTRVILVERHPCDAVLSCFMANFQLNDAMRSFTDLEEAARTYDTVFDAWTRAVTLLPIAVHRVRYERMVDDLEAEMRPLLSFLGVPWQPQVLDHQASATKRGHIRTASYSQVTEPLYRRSAGRWERYRRQLAHVLPILEPWAERMGYEV